MGQEKEQQLMDDEARIAAAERDGRNCPFCGEVIPYGVASGPNGEGPECVGAVRED